MTTIAYNHKDKQIAYDGQVTRGEIIMHNGCDKLIIRNDVMFFLCGSAGDYDLLINAYFGEKPTSFCDACAFVIDTGNVFRIGIERKVLWKNIPEFNDAIGSGGMWAIAAMDFGNNAEEAVSYASTKDIYTGGTIRVINI